MAKKTPPNFNAGWAYFPGASNFEIKIDATGHYSPATVRQFGNKKIVTPDDKGIIRLYDDEKQLRDFDPKEVLEKMLQTPSVVLSNPNPTTKEKSGRKEIIKANATEEEIDEQMKGKSFDEQIEIANNTLTKITNHKPTIDTMKTTTTKKSSKGKGSKAVAPKKSASKKSDATTATTTPVKRTGLPLLADLKVTKEEEKIAKLKTQYSIKAWKLHEKGRTVKEIMVILNRPDKHTSTPTGIDRYKASKKLQAKADAVKVD